MREHVIAQGTIQNTHYAQQYGVSMNIAGGTHHAFRDRPGAFCMLNDQAIASNYLIENNLAKRVMIVDQMYIKEMELHPFLNIKILFLLFHFMVKKLSI